jgi:hypothetical protein
MPVHGHFRIRESAEGQESEGGKLTNDYGKWNMKLNHKYFIES